MKTCCNDFISWSAELIWLGFRPRVRPPDIKPSANPTSSNTASLAEARLRSVRTSRVSRPWMVLASAQRCRPASVLGPVLRPPCVLHTRLPLMAGAAHCSFVRLDLAWQRWHVTRPPSVLSVCSKCKVCVFMGCTRCRGSRREKKFFARRTLWTVLPPLPLIFRKFSIFLHLLNTF